MEVPLLHDTAKHSPINVRLVTEQKFTVAMQLNKGVGGSPREASTDIGDTLRPMDEAKPVLCDASTSMGERTLRVAMVTNSSVITEGEFGSKATGSGEWVSEDSLKSSTQVNEDQEILTETDALYQVRIYCGDSNICNIRKGHLE